MVKRGSHCVYETQYHLVWAPKYRKWVLQGEIRKRVKELFREIGQHHGYWIQEMEVDKDHVHIFLSFPPKNSISEVVRIFKSVSSKIIREEYPQVKNELWGGEFWEDGYFARTVGDKITAEVIKRYIKYHKNNKVGGEQMDLF